MSVPFSVHESRAGAVLRRAFIATSSFWAAALPGSVYAGTRPHVTYPIALLVGGVYAIGSIVCHQLPERSFHLWGAQMPVCARCAGIYVGAAVAALVSALSRVRLKAGPTIRRTVRATFFAAALPTIATLAYEWITAVTPSNAIRALAGFPLGAAIALIVLTAPDNQVD